MIIKKNCLYSFSIGKGDGERSGTVDGFVKLIFRIKKSITIIPTLFFLLYNQGMNFLSSLPFFPLSYFPYPPSDLPVFLTPPQMISIRARPVPEQFNVWDISVFDPTLYYSECMTFGVTLIEDKTYLFSSSVANFCPAFWQRARAKGLTDEDDLYNPHALDDSWQIGCN